MREDAVSDGRPLRVAIVGAGPAGFYAAGALVRQDEIPVAIDMFDRLPTPYGLVRYGVAPDHQKIKLVIRVYEKTARDPRVRYFGNVDLGRDVSTADLKELYDQVVYAVGAATDRKLGIPGEELSGSYSATEFVAWYNAHPDFADHRFDFEPRSAVVVGVGNVAVDVIRILAKSREELAATDIADPALEALAASKVEEIHVLSRRGPVQAKFSAAELREVAGLENADVIVDPADLALDPLSEKELADDPAAQKNLEILHQLAERPAAGRTRRIHFHFLVSPVEIVGTEGRVTSVVIERNRLEPRSDGRLAARGTGEREVLEAGLVFRSIGYLGVPIAGIPFDRKRGVIPNLEGRVTNAEDAHVRPGEYVVGWAKRGPTGLIGTNKMDAVETVKHMLEDAKGIDRSAGEGAAAIAPLLSERGVRWVSFADWEVLDRLEQERGSAPGRPRVKFLRREEMLKALSRESG
ncbi:MAG TPA: FAD-dependent oxidoreductase [Thermoanaerobaculia bacterium]|nr:FAD-dependent oxidoreductase [Thermoanaerobaculia bacterium]